MPFDWENYLVIARELRDQVRGSQGNTKSEALKRTAISRAYYAAYHFAEDFAQTSLSYIPTTKDAHTSLREHYRRQFGNVNHQDVRPTLARLHRARKKSDYDPDGLGDIDA